METAADKDAGDRIRVASKMAQDRRVREIILSELTTDLEPAQ